MAQIDMTGCSKRVWFSLAGRAARVLCVPHLSSGAAVFPLAVSIAFAPAALICCGRAANKFTTIFKSLSTLTPATGGAFPRLFVAICALILLASGGARAIPLTDALADPNPKCSDKGAPGAPADGKNHGTANKPIKLEETNAAGNAVESTPIRMLTFKTVTGMCDVIEAGTTTTVSDTLEFTAPGGNATDFFIMSDKDSDEKEKGPDIENVTITANDGKMAFYQIVSTSETVEPPSLVLVLFGLAVLISFGRALRRSL